MAEEHFDELRQRLIGFGEQSSRKSYFPELQRKLAKLKESEERFHTLVNTIPDLVWLKNSEGVFLSCNRRFELLFGVPEAEIVGKTDYDFVSTELADFFREHDRKVMEAGQPISNEEWLTFASDGYRGLFETVKTPFLDVNGSVLGVLGVARDITERKQAESELAKYRDHLEQLVEERTRQLEEARNAAEAATQAKSDFLANMSHEIRTPMNGVLGMIYLALKSDMSPTVRNHLVKAQRSANALLGIINDILDFSKIEAGKMEIEATEFGLNAVVEQLLDAIILQTEKKGIEFLVRYDVNLPTRLIGDPMRLAQVLLNLCGNAIKFTESGEVELSFQRIDATDTGLTLQISVRDTGIGMTPEQRDRLFQKFTQADQSSSRRFGGTGLGLVICKHLVELMGGRIWIEHSEPGKGTTMCCTVQLKTVPNIDAIKLKLSSRAYPLLKGVRVLVVDDNDVSLQILAETLRLFQFDVHVASSGVKAIECLEQASSKPFDVVLIDWHMPGMNGDEVALRIHADRLIRHQPKVVMVTAYGREDVIKLANKAGVDGFLTKPVSPSSLLDAMLSVLGGGDFLLPEHKKAEAGGSIAVPPLFTGAKLLLAEDNEINREFAVELLHSMGIEVAVAMDGEEAVEKVRQEIYDAILMDIQMPKLDGLKATQQIRELSKTKQDRFASVPIIAMTAQAMAGDREKSLAAGMNDYITKPIDPERLISVLTQWVRVPEERRVATLTAAAQSTGTKAAREYSADMLALKSINAAQGIHRIGGKPDAYRKQLLRFREHYADAAETLQGLIAQQGLQAGEDYCHALKGVCGNLGAEELLACATEVDAALKQNKLPEAAQFAHLSRLLDEVVREIDGLVTPIRPVASLTGTALSAMLAKLATLLESDLGAAEALLNELRLGVAGTETEPAMIEIAAKADAFETDAARQLIDALRARLVAVAG